MSVPMNEMGDVMLDDADRIRALADPDRLAVFEKLQRHGPVTAAGFSTRFGLEDEVVLESLQRLEAVGLVTRDRESWTAHGRGLYLQLPDDDPEAAAAARALANVMLLSTENVLRDWVDRVEPSLEPHWAQATGMFGARPTVTPDELATIQAELDKLMEPYINREQAPEGARRVRILGYFLPDAPPA